jgi:hypothetical protein
MGQHTHGLGPWGLQRTMVLGLAVYNLHATRLAIGRQVGIDHRAVGSCIIQCSQELMTHRAGWLDSV